MVADSKMRLVINDQSAGSKEGLGCFLLSYLKGHNIQQLVCSHDICEASAGKINKMDLEKKT